MSRVGRLSHDHAKLTMFSSVFYLQMHVSGFNQKGTLNPVNMNNHQYFFFIFFSFARHIALHIFLYRLFSSRWFFCYPKYKLHGQSAHTLYTPTIIVIVFIGINVVVSYHHQFGFRFFFFFFFFCFSFLQ